MYMRNEIKNEEEQKLWRETIISGTILWIILAVLLATGSKNHFELIIMTSFNAMIIALGCGFYMQKESLLGCMIQMFSVFSSFYFCFF